MALLPFSCKVMRASLTAVDCRHARLFLFIFGIILQVVTLLLALYFFVSS